MKIKVKLDYDIERYRLRLRENQKSKTPNTLEILDNEKKSFTKEYREYRRRVA